MPDYPLSNTKLTSSSWQWLNRISKDKNLALQIFQYSDYRASGDQNLWQDIGQAGVSLITALQDNNVPHGVSVGQNRLIMPIDEYMLATFHLSLLVTAWAE